MLRASLTPPADWPVSNEGDRRAVVEGDLRPVTILLADIRGFTSLSEALPPEKMVGAINGCFEVLDQAIARHGGEVDKFLGDAVMAIFGAPIAHDDPRRAVQAALDQQHAGSDAPVSSYVVLGQAMRGRRRRGQQRHLGGEADLLHITRALAPLGDGRGAVLDVEGGAGSGKTALTQAVRRAA